MTINLSNNNPRVNYTATSGQTAFTIPFDYFDDGDISVYQNGTLKTITTHYTISGSTMTLVTGATAGDKIAITRDVPLERTTDLTSTYSASSINSQLDTIVAQIADLDDRVSRSISLNDYEVAVSLDLPATADRLGKTIQFNSSTGALEVGPSGDELTSIASIASEITALDGISANITTVAGAISNVNSVGSNISSVTSVAGSISNINTVNTNIANVNLVGASIADVNDVADSIDQVELVAGSISNVDTVALANSNISTVAGDISNINTVAGISSNITTVAGITAAISTVNSNAADITTVSNNIDDVNDVANVITKVTSVADNIANVNTLAPQAANIGALAGISGSINTLGSISSELSTLAAVADDIGDAATNAAAAEAAKVAAEAAQAAAELAADNFDDIYLGSKASDPSVDNDGDALNAGDLYFNTTSNTMRVYSGSAWQDAAVDSSGFVQTTGDTMTGDLDIQGTLTSDGLTVEKSGASQVVADFSGTGANAYIQLNDGNSTTFAGLGVTTDSLSLWSLNKRRIDISSGGDISFYEDTGTTAKFFWDASAESLGIGNTNPSALDITANDLVVGGGSGNKGITIFSGTTSTGGIVFADGDDGTVSEYRGWVSYDHSTDALRFASASSERMRIDSSGNLLVGTTSNPSSRKLRVYGIAEIDGAGVGLLNFKSSGTSIGSVGQGNYVVSGGPSGGLGMQSAAELVFGSGGTTERMRIDSSGRVGIGTSSPSAAGSGYGALDVRGAAGGGIRYGVDGGFNMLTYATGSATDFYASAASDMRFFTQGDLTTSMVITSSGDVGIGTSSPNTSSGYTALAINGTTSGWIQLMDDGTNVADWYSSGGTESTFRAINGGLNFAVSGASDVKFNINSSERMRITSSGNVGIGTASPTANHRLTLDNAGFVQALLSTSGTARLSLYGDSAVSAVDAKTNPLAFYAGSSERMRITSSGQVGIGTSSPLGPLHLAKSGTSDYTNMFFQNTGASGRNYQLGVGGSNTGVYSGKFYIYDSTASQPRFSLDSSGNVGIGTLSPTSKLHLYKTGTSDNIINIQNGQDAYASILSLTANNDGGAVYNSLQSSTNGGTQHWKISGGASTSTMAFSTGGTERLRIDSSGNLFVGATALGSNANFFGMSPGNAFFDVGHITGVASGVSYARFIYGGSVIGSITQSGTTAVAYNTSSDYRLKENVVDLTGATTRLKQLEPKRFNFIADADTTVDGFLAHEVQSVVPEAITGTHNEVDADGNPVYQGIDQSKLVPLLVATIKELEARITALENA